jgi:copper chaperone CopZ
MNTAKLTVPDMTCGHCEMAVKNTLGPIAGVDEVIVDLPTKSVRVSYDPAQVSVDQMGVALAEEFYPVAAVEEVVAS